MATGTVPLVTSPSRTFRVALPVDLLGSLRPVVAASQDPTIRVRRDEVVRATRTPEGPTTLHLRRVGHDRFHATAHGPGADGAVAGAPALVGGVDDLAGFDAHAHPTVARLHHRRPGLRVIRTGLVWDVLVPTILGQRVTYQEASRAWTRLVRDHGEPAPGPYGLRLPPAPETCAAIPDWTWHALGVERARAAAIRSASRYAGHLQRALRSPPDDRLATFTRVPGIGPWTAGRVLRVAAGDADAVEVGDFHLKHIVAHNLAGEARGTDERMLELLAPFAGHRGRVARLLTVAGQRPPAFGPRGAIVAVDRL